MKFTPPWSDLHKTVSGNPGTVHEFESEITAQKKALDEERRERNREDAGIRELIDQAVAGGLTLEAMGLVWLVVGLLLSTTSTEMAKLLP